MKILNDKNKKGFTLIEMLVVMIIIGILAAITVPNLFSNVPKSRAPEAFAKISTIRPVIEACIAAHPGSESTCTFPYMFPGQIVAGYWINTATFGYSGCTNNTCLVTAPTNGFTGFSVSAFGLGPGDVQYGMPTGPFTWGADYITITRSSAATGSYGTITCASYGALAGSC